MKSIFFFLLISLCSCSRIPAVIPPPPVQSPEQPTVGEEAEPEPNKSTENLEGRWKGQVLFEGSAADLTVELTQDLVFIRGRGELKVDTSLFKITLPGEVSGLLKYDEISFTLTPDDPKYCYYKAVATRTDDRLLGKFTGVNCTDNTIAGDFYLDKVEK